MGIVPIIIPAYEPDERLIALLDSLRQIKAPVILINDGSDKKYDRIFSRAEPMVRDSGGAILIHEKNMGKGRALKTGFRYVQQAIPEAIGVVTADSDGQHSQQCIAKIINTLRSNPDALILGVRDFTGENIPWKSRAGNAITENVFCYLTGIHVADTQTGLRGIPMQQIPLYLGLQGDRFEFEMQMLVACVRSYPIMEVPIETIYDSATDHQTHFHPLKDSIRIYRALGKQFSAFLLSSGSSCAVDLSLFYLFCLLLKGHAPLMYIAFATAIARVISAAYNYWINYILVFHSKKRKTISGLQYALLAVLQGAASALLVSLAVKATGAANELPAKCIVDGVLFFISYRIQKKYIF